MNLRTSFAHDPVDSAEVQVEKLAAFIVAGLSCVAGVGWTVMYTAVFGWGLTAALPFIFTLIVGTSLVVAHVQRDHRYAVYAQIICIIYITTFIQWSIGGVSDSGFVLAWAFIGPIVALVFFSLRQSLAWFGLYLVNVVITVAFDGTFAANAQDVGEGTLRVFVALNLGVSSLVVFVFAGFFVTEALRERERANRLLLNVLPKEIAPILKESDATIADHFESASVLFADIVGSTPLFADLDPAQMVDWLNEVFSMFDALVEQYDVEKIRTIGDNYMAAAGVPVPRDDHARCLPCLHST